MFINCSNHSSLAWPQSQIVAAQKYGDIVDISFPLIPADADSKTIDDLVEKYYQKIMELKPNAVMLQGEFCFTYRLTTRLKKTGVTVLAACSDRKVIEKVSEDGSTVKQSVFEFVQFREY